MGRIAPFAVGLVCGALAASCAFGPPALVPGAPVQFVRSIVFYGHPVKLHLVRPCRIAPDHPLLLFATGDGGWRGKDLATFRQLAQWNYPLAGFSSPDYLRRLGDRSDTTTPERLARDYGRFIKVAKEAMGLPPGTPTVLVGVSRGAGLSVVAAGQTPLQPSLAGVLAVALTKEEEYVRHFPFRLGRHAAGDRADRMVMVQTYAYLPRLRAVPIVVIQSTHDNYLPAARARVLFGSDTALRRFHAIAARDHSFDGARDTLYAEMQSSLAWICRPHAAAGAAAGRETP